MVDFELYMTTALSILSRQMVSLIETGAAGEYDALEKSNTEILQRKQKGEAALDAAMWAAFLAFDIIGDLVGQCSPDV